MVNLLIAILSNVYQEVVDSANAEYSHILFIDYNINKHLPSYSFLQSMLPIFNPLSTFLLPLCAFWRNPTFNKYLHFLDYLFKFLCPLLIVNLVFHLLALPLVYLKVLLCILNNAYQKPDGTYISIQIRLRVIHFLTFLVLGPLYLLYNGFLHSPKFLCCKAVQYTPPDEYIYLFNMHQYECLKQTLIYFKQNA